MTAKTVFVTGASGFIGSALVNILSSKHSLKVCYRSLQLDTIDNAHTSHSQAACIPRIDADTSWLPHLHEVDTVIHLAGYAHKSKDINIDELYAVNVEGSKRLAEQAAKTGVRRFIYLSSIKAVTESTEPNQPVTENTPEHPEDAYGRSKLAAEKAIIAVCENSGMEYVIIRPTLVIGPQVKGNLLSLKNWVSKGWPLPTGAIQNSRSLLSLTHLIALIETCVGHPNAANQIFLAADKKPISTPELIHLFEQSLGKNILQIPLPVCFLSLVGRVLGRTTQVQRLCGNLEVDTSLAHQRLAWESQYEIGDISSGERQ